MVVRSPKPSRIGPRWMGAGLAASRAGVSWRLLHPAKQAMNTPRNTGNSHDLDISDVRMFSPFSLRLVSPAYQSPAGKAAAAGGQRTAGSCTPRLFTRPRGTLQRRAAHRRTAGPSPHTGAARGPAPVAISLSGCYAVDDGNNHPSAESPGSRSPDWPSLPTAKFGAKHRHVRIEKKRS